MYNRILIIGRAEGFIIKGVETKLSGIGVESVFSTPKMDDIKNKCTDTDLIIIFTDEDVSNMADALVYLKDFCNEHGKQVALIGTKNEYELAAKYISRDLIFTLFERPLDMENLISQIDDYMHEDSQEARKKCILIVDDDVTYMSMIMDWLKDKYRVFMANSGMKAITWLAKNHADLILLDYEMPITTGPQVLEMIRSDFETADIPVVFLTGKSDRESIMKVLALKPVGYQLKTVDRSTLRQNIDHFFATRTANR